MVKTYWNWKELKIRQAMDEYSIPRSEAVWVSAPSRRWYSEEIEPALNQGEKLRHAVCRSIAKYGGGLSLLQIAKHFPDQIPQNISLSTGKIL